MCRGIPVHTRLHTDTFVHTNSVTSTVSSTIKPVKSRLRLTKKILKNDDIMKWLDKKKMIDNAMIAIDDSLLNGLENDFKMTLSSLNNARG